MTDAVIFEWRRLRTARTTWALSLALLVLSCGVAALETFSHSTGNGPFLAATAAFASFGGPLAAALGAIAIGNEFRFGSIKWLFTAFPRRTEILVVKIAVVAVFLVVVCTLCSFAGAIVGLIVTDNHGIHAPGFGWAGLGARATAVMVGYACFGFGVTALTRSQPLAIVLAILVPTLESSITVFAHQDWLRHVLPFSNAADATDLSTPAFASTGIFLIWAAAFVAAGCIVADRRDA